MSDSDQDPMILESDNPLKAIAVVELEIDEPDPEIKEEYARDFLEHNLIEYAGENSIGNNSVIEKPVIRKIVSGGESSDCGLCWGSGRVPGHKLPKADKNADYPCPECNREELQEYFPEIVQAYSDEPSGESGSTASSGVVEPPKSPNEIGNPDEESPNTVGNLEPDAVVYHSKLDYAGNRFATLEVEDSIDDEHREVKEPLYSQSTNHETIEDAWEKWYEENRERFGSATVAKYFKDYLINEVFPPG